MTNTKARHKEIYAAAVKIVEKAGGVEAIDGLGQAERVPKLRQMATEVMATTNCTSYPARSNVSKAMQGRKEKDQWGGARPNTGPVPLPQSEKRQPVSTRLAPGSKELAQAIAEVLELPGWGHAVDQALVRMVEGDRELKIQLAKMGIVVKGNMEKCNTCNENVGDDIVRADWLVFCNEACAKIWLDARLKEEEIEDQRSEGKL